jgi:biotin carboxyl carrier protein
MIYIVRINNKEYEVEVERGKANLVKTTGITASEPLPSTPAAWRGVVPVTEKVEVPTAHSAANAITAPMPGTILNIKVSAGTRVKMGEALIVLEAMKMENEITAPSDGVIAQVFVTKGSSVATGDALISMQ